MSYYILETQLQTTNRRFCGTNKFSFKCTEDYFCQAVVDSSLISPKYWSTEELRNTVILTLTAMISYLDIDVIYDVY